MPGIILVTGANGRTGRAVVSALRARGAHVRGFIRNEAQRAWLQAQGCEAAIGDLEDSHSIAAACRGCDSVLHIGPPIHPQEVAITSALLQASLACGVKHFVYYSVMQPLRQDVFHHRQKLIAEAHVVEAGIAYTILQPTRYMQHLEALWPRVRDAGVHAMPFNTEARFNVVDLDDVASVAAMVATEPGHEYASYELAGPQALSQTDMAAILSEELGRPVVAQAVSPDAFRQAAVGRGLPEERIDHMLTMNGHYDRHGFLGNANVLRWVLGREPGTFRDYVRRLMRG